MRKSKSSPPARHAVQVRHVLGGTLLALTLAAHQPARAHQGSTALSTASMLPVAVSVAAPVALLSAGAVLSVVAIEASAEGTVWVLERASDGARLSLRFAGAVAGGASLAAGTVITVSVVGTGQILSAAGEAIAFIPNEIGASLLHNERLTR